MSHVSLELQTGKLVHLSNVSLKSQTRERERERERERDRDRDRDRGTQRDRERQREIQRHRERQRERQTDRETDRWMDGLLYNQWIDHNIVGERHANMMKSLVSQASGRWHRL